MPPTCTKELYVADPINPTARMTANFSPAPLPPIQDGAPQLEPAPVEPLPISPISLCELGPCANFHRLVSKVDAQDPLDGSSGEVRVTVTRTCYPSPGIEFDLSGQPVKECNRHDPVDGFGYAPVPITRRAKVERFKQFSSEEHNAFEKSWADATAHHQEDAHGDR